MNRKIVIISILAVLMLITISYATAYNTNTTNTDNKESPLWRIRTRKAIGEKISTIIENIKTKFLGERLFWIPIPIILKREKTGRLYFASVIKENTCDICWQFTRKGTWCNIRDGLFEFLTESDDMTICNGCHTGFGKATFLCAGSAPTCENEPECWG